MPSSFASWRNSRITSSEASGSRLAIGSSASSACGRCAKARAMEARCAWPPDRVLARWWANLVKPTRSRHCMAWPNSLFGRMPKEVARLPRWRPSVPHTTLAITLRRFTRFACWNTMPSPMRALARSRPWRAVMSCPASRTAPSVGLVMPAIIRIMVDLPLPLAPRITANSPAGTERLALCSASLPVA